MQLKLPKELTDKLEQQLGAEFPAFLAAYEQEKVAGLRANGLKVQPELLKNLLPYLQEAVEWCRDGFYYADSEVRPAKHPYYYAGLYYIQEPSAMLPAQLLAASPGQRVLDLCAAPGGKSVQIAGQLARNGLLVTNDIHPQRAKALLKNMERYGVVNVVVTNETPDRLAKVFAGYFDKILVDAPCSGEGMFRKEPAMANDWSVQEVAKYARWQQEILSYVPDMLRDEGEIVYSTCTFSPEENEIQVQNFVNSHPEFHIQEMRRLWPHQNKGEGHFAARIKEQNTPSLNTQNDPNVYQACDISNLRVAVREALQEFSRQVWKQDQAWLKWLPPGGLVIERNGHILWEDKTLPSLKGLKVLRSGWLLGVWEKGRFRPSQAFAMGLPQEAALSAQRCNFSAGNEQGRYGAIRYLRGETIQIDNQEWPSGWHLVTIDGFVLGWAKGAGHSLKNDYPPGWRWED